ncbi:hypothetical protein [Pseudomonas sp. DG56-2]|uniref:hypothetical protein n=1 Tax=Pseudomonas sp. DG56-2 TaxID=2320270 RepID=UPI0010A614FD|nr:hypothetical protein [Pseudomonas sp. DG56-2]
MLNDYGKSLFKPWLSVQNVVLGFFLIFVVGLVIRQYALTSSEIASWVQAVGSVGAIWGALALGRQQIRNQDAMRFRELEVKSGAFLGVFESACKNSNKIAELAGLNIPVSHFSMRWELYISELYRTNIAMLKGIPAHELGGYDLVSAHAVILSVMLKIEADLLRLFEVDEGADVQARWSEHVYAQIISHNKLVQTSFESFRGAHQERLEKLRAVL